MSFERNTCDSKGLSNFECDIKTIKNYLCDIADSYLLVSYRIYEMKVYESFKPYYKNIVEACAERLGFKKSTTYNMIRIVERFGEIDETTGFISYQSLFGYRNFSYSQLTEMLSLSDNQIEKVKPGTTVSEIRQIKKETFQTSGKTEIIDVDTYVIAENGIEEIKENVITVSSAPTVPEETFQTSGTVYDKIKSMSCKELAEFLYLNHSKTKLGYKKISEWLESDYVFDKINSWVSS